MSQYTSVFGVTRFVGTGSGRDELCDATAKPALGANNVITVVVNENGPVENAGTEFGRGAAKIPAGALVVKGTLLVKKKGSAAGVSLNLVDKDGTNPISLMGPYTPDQDEEAEDCSGAAIGAVMSDAKYVKVSGTTTGLDAMLVLEYI